MSQMHPTAAKGFNDPATYERGRPGYPQAAIDALGLSADVVVADLGCGTGKMSAALAGSGARVIGLDPLEGMLSPLRSRLPSVPALAALAEAIPLSAASVDVVVCASAFHWFDHARALPEIHRVLRADGRLAIVWNRRDALQGWPKGFWDITEAHRGETPGYRTERWRHAIEESGLFGPIAEQHFDHVQRTDLEGLLARVASISFIELLPPAQKQEVLDASRRFIETHPETRDRTTFELPYRTALYVCARR